MADDCDEDVIFDNSALYKHLVDAGVPDIPVESTGKAEVLSQNEKETMDDLSQPKDTLQNVLQFLKAVDHKLKIYLSVDLLFTKLHSYQNNLLLQKIIQNKALEDDDKIFLENYISETRESADLNKGKEVILCCVFPLFAIILLYMWCLFSPLSAMILMNPTFNIIRMLMKCYMLIMVGLVAVLVWHVSLLKHRARQVLDFLQQAEASIALQKKSLRLIQEVELVRKGFTLVSTQISISKAENSSPVNQRLCPELRHLIFLTSRSNMLSCRRTTRLLLEHYPLIDEVDKASTYLANIPLEDYGPSLQQVEEDDKSKEKLSKLTDDFSVTALKAMLYLYGMQQSELVRRLALCFCVNAQPENQKGKLNSSICPLVVNLNKQLVFESIKLGNSYEFHRSSFQERDVKSSPPNQKQAMSSVSELYMAVHSLDLHLRAALHRSFALSTELEKFTEDEIQQKGELNAEDKETDEEIQENLSKKEKLWYDQLKSVKAELEACRGCWEVGLDKINKIYKKKETQVPKLSPTSEGEPEKKIQVISADDIDPVIVDEVFEDYTDPDKDEFECNYVHLSPEEREKREQDREESRRMMFELRNVIAVRATDMERREEVAVKRNQMQKDDTLCASSHSSTDAEQSDDSLHTDSLQSDSLQSDLPNKDDDSMQQSGNLNEDLIDEDPLASDEEFSPNKLKDLTRSEESSVNQISWSKSLSLNPEGEQQETTPFFLHQVADPVESDHFSDLHLRNLLFSPTADTTDTESLNTDSLHENSKADQLDSIDGSDNLPPLKNGGTDVENNSSHQLSKQNEFKLSSDSPQFSSDQSFSFVLHAGAENSSRGSSRSPSLTPTHRLSNTNSNHINNNANLSTPPPPLNTDSTSSTQGSCFFLHTKADDDDDDSSSGVGGGKPLPKRSLKGTNLMDLQERWAANSGGPGLSLTRNIAAMASARCKEQLNLNIQTFGDEEETFGDDSFDEDDSKLSDDELSKHNAENKIVKD